MFLLSCHWKEGCSYAEHCSSVQLQAISALLPLPLEAFTAGAVSSLQALWVCMETLGTSELEPSAHDKRSSFSFPIPHMSILQCQHGSEPEWRSIRLFRCFLFKKCWRAFSIYIKALAENQIYGQVTASSGNNDGNMHDDF